jgi:hypothetical protein
MANFKSTTGNATMKNIFALIIFTLFAFSACKAKYSFNSYEGKKKLKYYNSIQYGHHQYPKAKKSNK